MNSRSTAMWLLLALAPSGCSSPETNGESNTQNANNTASTNGTTKADDPDAGDVGSSIVVELVPVEWGLFRDAVAPTSVQGGAVQSNGAWVASLDVGPGAWAVRVTSGGDVVVDASQAAADRLVPVAGDVAHQPFFVPAASTLEFEIDEAASWTISAQVIGDGVDLDLDDPSALTAGGRWFDDGFASIVSANDPGAGTVTLMEAIRERGGPIATERGVLFIAPAQDGESAPQIRGSWNNFSAEEQSELHRVTPGFWARFIQVPSGEQTYKIYYPDGGDDGWATDISNPHIEWDGINPNTVGNFNSVIGDVGVRTVWMRDVAAPELNNERDVYVHLPASYDGSMKEYPTLYIHDGNESIVRAQYPIVADESASSDLATEAVLVFVALPSQDVRLAEYTMASPGSLGDEYVDFLADTLVPMIDASFRTRQDRIARGLHGASLGGLISFWGAMQHPDVFGYTAGMSSTFCWPTCTDGEPPGTAALDELMARGCQDVTYYLDSGSPNDNYAVTQTMRDALDGLGCAYDYVLESGGQHDWSFWRGRFSGVLRDFADLHGG